MKRRLKENEKEKTKIFHQMLSIILCMVLVKFLKTFSLALQTLSLASVASAWFLTLLMFLASLTVLVCFCCRCTLFLSICCSSRRLCPGCCLAWHSVSPSEHRTVDTRVRLLPCSAGAGFQCVLLSCSQRNRLSA